MGAGGAVVAHGREVDAALGVKKLARNEFGHRASRLYA
jgi:hypothetical protein